MVDIEALRASIQQAQEALETFNTQFNNILVFLQKQTQEDDNLTIIAEHQQPSFIYPFPSGPETMHDGAQWFAVTGHHGSIKMLLAETKRDRRGAQRSAKVVFAHLKDTDHPSSAMICVEFTETDNPGEFCCEIPDPADPQKALKDGMSIPSRFAHAVVRRTDQLYTSVKHGPTLRLVVQGADTNAMLAHGLWVASLRKRI